MTQTPGTGHPLSSGNFLLSKAFESLEGRKSREEEKGLYLLTNAPHAQLSQ